MRVIIARDYPEQKRNICDTLYYSINKKDFIVVPIVNKRPGYLKLTTWIGWRMILFFLSNLAVMEILGTIVSIMVKEGFGGYADRYLSVGFKILIWVYIAFFLLFYRKNKARKFAMFLAKHRISLQDSINQTLFDVLKQKNSMALYDDLCLLHSICPTGINNNRRASILLQLNTIDSNWHGETDSLLMGDGSDSGNPHVFEYLSRVQESVPFILGEKSRQFLQKNDSPHWK